MEEKTIEITIEEYKELIRIESLVNLFLQNYLKANNYISYEDIAAVFGWEAKKKEHEEG